MRLRLIITCLILLAACGPLPQPFQPESKPDDLLINLPDGGGVQVVDLLGERPQPAGSMALVMVEELQRQNLPAFIDGGNLASYRLQGRAVLQPLGGGEEEILIAWELLDPQGRRAGLVNQRKVTRTGRWTQGDLLLLREVAAEAGPQIAAMIQNPTVEEALIPGFPGARMAIQPMEFLPGDGFIALPQALEAALLSRDIPLTNEAGGADLLVFADVYLGDPVEGEQGVLVHWVVVKGPELDFVGEMQQQNLIPAGAMDGTWGPLARLIAEAAADGILEMLDQAGRRALPPS